MPAGVSASLRPDGRLELRYRRTVTAAGTVLEALARAGIGIVDVATEEPHLEDVFVELTRRRPVA